MQSIKLVCIACIACIVGNYTACGGILALEADAHDKSGCIDCRLFLAWQGEWTRQTDRTGYWLKQLESEFMPVSLLCSADIKIKQGGSLWKMQTFVALLYFYARKRKMYDANCKTWVYRDAGFFSGMV